MTPDLQPPFRHAHVGGCLDVAIEARADGSSILRSREPLEVHAARLTDRLEHWAAVAPDRTFIAQRAAQADRAGAWIRISYAEMLGRARRLGQALVDAGLSADRPLAILSDNDLEHASLLMAAMWAGVPAVSVSPAYSLLSADHAKLRHILGLTTPGMIYATQADFATAIGRAAPSDAVLVFGDQAPLDVLGDALPGRPVRRFGELLEATPSASGEAAHDATGADTVVKILFTSGSTNLPKGVTTTHRMLCSNQQMLRQCMAFLADDEPPVLVDWLPWSHTFGGNHNLGIALYNGGTFHIDEGRPTPARIGETLRNLREISPTVYFNVPKGLEEIAAAMDGDTVLRDSLFRRLNAFMFAAASLSQAAWNHLEHHAVAATGERVRILTSLGMTETAPSCTFLVGTHARAGYIGLPGPGIEVKLTPVDDKIEIRVRGPNVTPGYWRNPEQTAGMFDSEGFYRTGDAVRWVDPDRPELGLSFDGRLAEDFKLSTGTFVNVGPLRARVVHEGHPCVQDAVPTAPNQTELGVLVFPRIADCRRLAGLPDDAPFADALAQPRVREFFQDLCDRLHAQGTGSASRVTRLQVLVEPPSVEGGEITDKNSINQRAVLTRRAALVAALHGEVPPADPAVFMPRDNGRNTTS